MQREGLGLHIMVILEVAIKDSKITAGAPYRDICKMASLTFSDAQPFLEMENKGPTGTKTQRRGLLGAAKKSLTIIQVRTVCYHLSLCCTEIVLLDNIPKINGEYYSMDYLCNSH